jgi:hypothetical protein
VCETDAGVAGGALDDGAARVQEAKALGVFDDEEGGAVFYGAAWVLELGFSEDGAAGFFGEALEADEGGLSDCWGDVSMGVWTCKNVRVQEDYVLPSMKPRFPMPCAFEMLIIV